VLTGFCDASLGREFLDLGAVVSFRGGGVSGERADQGEGFVSDEGQGTDFCFHEAFGYFAWVCCRNTSTGHGDCQLLNRTFESGDGSGVAQRSDLFAFEPYEGIYEGAGATARVRGLAGEVVRCWRRGLA
jgi:hypothetical protein